VSDAFDPYQEWLGIPPPEQPPHHYRLLGVRVFENDVRAIDEAADRRMAQLRAAQIGRRAELSQRLLNEVAGARACLMHPRRRAAYDAELKRHFGEQPIRAAPSAPLNAEQPLASPGEAPISPSPPASLDPLAELDLEALAPLEGEDPLAGHAPLGAAGRVLHDPLYGPGGGYAVAPQPTSWPAGGSRSTALRIVWLAAVIVLAMVSGLMLLISLVVLFRIQGAQTETAEDSVAANPSTSEGSSPSNSAGPSSLATTEPGAAWLANPRTLEIPTSDPFPTIALSPDGSLLACAEHNIIHTLDVATARHRSTLGGDLGVPRLMVWPPGQAVVYGTDRGEVRHGVISRRLQDSTPIRSLALSPDGSRIAAVGSFLHVWDSQQWTPIGEKTPVPRLTNLNFSPDSKVIVGSLGRSKLYFFGEPADVAALEHPRRGKPFLIDWSDIGGLEAYYADPEMLRIVDFETRRVLLERYGGGDPQSPPGLRFLPRSTTLAVFYLNRIELLHNGQDKRKGSVLSLDHPCWKVSIAADGNSLAVAAGRTATVWEIRRNPPNASQKPFN
jgi:hypothetical protein